MSETNPPEQGRDWQGTQYPRFPHSRRSLAALRVLAFSNKAQHDELDQAEAAFDAEDRATHEAKHLIDCLMDPYRDSPSTTSKTAAPVAVKGNPKYGN